MNWLELTTLSKLASPNGILLILPLFNWQGSSAEFQLVLLVHPFRNLIKH